MSCYFSEDRCSFGSEAKFIVFECQDQSELLPLQSGLDFFSRKHFCPQYSSGLVVPWLIMNSNFLLFFCRLSMKVTNAPETPKVSGSNLTRTCFYGKYSGSNKVRLIICLLMFYRLSCQIKESFFFAVNNFHCSCFKYLSKNPADSKFVFNTGVHFTNSIFQNVFFQKCLSFFLFYWVNKFRLNLYRPSDLLLRRCVRKKFFCVRVL